MGTCGFFDSKKHEAFLNNHDVFPYKGLVGYYTFTDRQTVFFCKRTPLGMPRLLSGVIYIHTIHEYPLGSLADWYRLIKPSSRSQTQQFYPCFESPSRDSGCSSHWLSLGGCNARSPLEKSVSAGTWKDHSQ